MDRWQKTEGGARAGRQQAGRQRGKGETEGEGEIRAEVRRGRGASENRGRGISDCGLGNNPGQGVIGHTPAPSGSGWWPRPAPAPARSARRMAQRSTSKESPTRVEEVAGNRQMEADMSKLSTYGTDLSIRCQVLDTSHECVADIARSCRQYLHQGGMLIDDFPSASFAGQHTNSLKLLEVFGSSLSLGDAGVDDKLNLAVRLPKDQLDQFL